MQYLKVLVGYNLSVDSLIAAVLRYVHFKTIVLKTSVRKFLQVKLWLDH